VRFWRIGSRIGWGHERSEVTMADNAQAFGERPHTGERVRSPIVVDGYVRVSWVGDRGGPNFISPEVQRDQIEAWAKLNGATIGKVFEELNESGGRSDRPRLLEALERIESGVSQGLVVAKLDRFGRSLIDGLSKIDRITAADGIFVSVQDGLDVSTPTGKLVLRIMFSMAEWELERIRANWVVAKQRAVDRGVHLGPYPPFGYRRDKNGRLHPDPQAAPVLVRVFKERAEGATVQSIADSLNESGLKTGKGSSQFVHVSVRRMLKNRVYLGETKSKDHVNPEAHRPLVDEATWQRAQRPNHYANERRATLLGGLLRCGACRMKMTSSAGARNAQMVRPSYHCARYTSAGECRHRARIRADEIEGLVEELVIRAARRSVDGRAVSRMKKAEVRLAGAQQALVRYRDDTSARSALGSERFAEGLVKRNDEVERRALQVANARVAAEPPIAVPENLEQVWPDLSLDERREVLEQFIDCIFVMPGTEPARDRVYVCLRGEEPIDTPSRGFPLGEIRAFDPGSARTVGLPRPALWGEQRIRSELLAWRGERTDWPSYAEFLNDGHARLYLQILEWGGHYYWAQKLGWGRPKKVRHYWDHDRVRGALRPYLAGKDIIPTLPEFEELGAGPVREAAHRLGGIGFWADEFGVGYRVHKVRHPRATPKSLS
jgi:site-specific DNA recombinase